MNEPIVKLCIHDDVLYINVISISGNQFLERDVADITEDEINNINSGLVGTLVDYDEIQSDRQSIKTELTPEKLIYHPLRGGMIPQSQL